MRHTSNRPANRKACFQPGFDALEARWCPSFSLGVVNGHILQALGDNNPGQIDFVDDGAGDIMVTADRGTPQTFRGIDQVVVRGGNGNDAVTYQLNPGDASSFLDGSVRPANLHIDLGGGDNSIGDTEYLPADGFLRVPWNIDITSGRGNTQVTTEFNNANINANLSVHFGNGVNSFAATLLYPDHNNTPPDGTRGGMNIDVFGGPGRNSFNLTAEGYTGTTFSGHGVQIAPLHANFYGSGIYDSAIIAILHLDMRAESQFGLHGGAGNDFLTFNGQDVNGYAPLDFVADGGMGNDVIQVQVGSPSSVAPGPCNIFNTWTENIRGGGGKDSLIGLLFPAVEGNGEFIWFEDAGGGDDACITTLLPAVQDGGVFSASFNLGAGNDTWSGSIAPTVESGGMASFDFEGGGGNNSWLWAERPSVQTDAVCNLHLGTGDGNNVVFGVIDPSLAPRSVCNIVIQGGRGNDTINELLNLPGLTAGCNLNVLIAGGAGNDNLALLTQGQADPLSVLNLQVDGGPGYDIATVASIVNVLNCEQKIVL